MPSLLAVLTPSLPSHLNTSLTWDEENLARTEAEKDSQMCVPVVVLYRLTLLPSLTLLPVSPPCLASCRKITEPKTPYVQYDALTDMVLSGASLPFAAL